MPQQVKATVGKPGDLSYLIPGTQMVEGENLPCHEGVLVT